MNHNPNIYRSPSKSKKSRITKIVSQIRITQPWNKPSTNPDISSNNSQKIEPELNLNSNKGKRDIQTLRQLRTVDLPSDSCAYVSAIDFINGSQFLTHLNCEYDDIPTLARLIRRTPFKQCKTSFAQLIPQIIKYSENQNLQIKLTNEDPFIIIQVIKKYLSTFSDSSIFPILRCSKCDFQRKPHEFFGDLQYVRQGVATNYILKNQCARQGHGEVFELGEIPSSFIVRLCGSVRKGIFDSPHIPFIKDYKAFNYLQYHPKNKHFRVVKIHGGSATILDGTKATIEEFEDYDLILNNSGWTTYLCQYKRLDHKQILIPKLNDKYWLPHKRQFLGSTLGKNNEDGTNNSSKKQESNSGEEQKIEKPKEMKYLRQFVSGRGDQGKLKEEAEQLHHRIRVASRNYTEGDRRILQTIRNYESIAMRLGDHCFRLESRLINAEEQNMVLRQNMTEMLFRLERLETTSNNAELRGPIYSKPVIEVEEQQPVINPISQPTKVEEEEKSPFRRNVMFRSNQQQQDKQIEDQQKKNITKSSIKEHKPKTNTMDRYMKKTNDQEEIKTAQYLRNLQATKTNPHAKLETKNMAINPTIIQQPPKIVIPVSQKGKPSSTNKITRPISENRNIKWNTPSPSNSLDNRNRRNRDRPKPPQKSCAWIAAFDLLEKSDWLLKYNVSQGALVNLISVLRGDCCKWAEAIDQIKQNVDGLFPNDTLETDAFLVITTIQELIRRNSQENIEHSLPVFSCDCSSGDRISYEGNLQYHQSTADRYELIGKTCQACKNQLRQGKYVQQWLPEDFIIRTHSEKQITRRTFDRPRLPAMGNYFPAAVIQYNRSLKHFRTLRLLHSNTVVLDGQTSVLYEQDKEKFIFEQDWIPYIIRYKRHKGAPTLNEYNGQTENISCWDYEIKFIGGSFEQPSKDNLLSILQWNVCSIRSNQPQKINFIKMSNPIIGSIQQARQNFQIPQYKTYNSLPQICADGGEKINSSLIVHEDYNCEIIIMRKNVVGVLIENSRLGIPTIVVSVYLHPSDRIEQKLQIMTQIYENVEKIRQRKPDVQILVLGDFNMDQQQIKSLNYHNGFSMLIRMGFNELDYTQETRKNTGQTRRQLDYMFSNVPIFNIRKLIQPNSNFGSDHAAIMGSIQTQNPRAPRTIPSRQYKSALYKLIESGSTLAEAKRVMMHSKIPKETQIQDKANYSDQQLKYFMSEEWWSKKGNQYKEAINKITEGSFKGNTKQFFRDLKKLTKYDQFEKRDGGLMVRAKDERNIIISGKELDQAIIEDYCKLHGQNQQNRQFSRYPLPDRYFNDDQLLDAAQNINKGKSGSWDCVTDQLFTIHRMCCSKTSPCQICEYKLKILKEIVTSEYWNDPDSKEHFKVRLVCLNKQYPNIPEIHRYRPITIASPIIKFLESLMMNRLKAYSQIKMNTRQYGFTKGVGIEQCKAQVLLQLQKLSEKTKIPNRRYKPHLLFTDYTSAYDSVNRQKLYELLFKKKILPPEEIELLKFIHNNLMVKIGDQQTTTSRGVPQGLISSPLLFNIYSEEILNKLNEMKIPSLMYADDVISIAEDREQCRKAIQILNNISEELELNINNKKSGIIIVGWKYKKGEQDIDSIPIVEEYKYLGTWINGEMNMNPHLERIDSKFTYISRKLVPIRCKLDLKLNTNLFKMLILPQVRMLGTLYHLADEKEKNSIVTNIRRKYRAFCMIPYTSPNQLIEELMGNTDMTLTNLYKISCHKANCRRYGMKANYQYIGMYKTLPPSRFIPRRLTRLIKVMYGKKCKQHKIPLTRTHLRQSHNCNADPLNMIKRYNQEKETVKQQIWKYLIEIDDYVLHEEEEQKQTRTKGKRTRGVRRTMRQ